MDSMPILEYKSLEKLLRKTRLYRNNKSSNINNIFEIKKESPKNAKLIKPNNKFLTDS
jgi:hypothetical protein